jgi:hypothetical protein
MLDDLSQVENMLFARLNARSSVDVSKSFYNVQNIYLDGGDIIADTSVSTLLSPVQIG